MMNGRHLPAGQQNMPDGNRRRQYNQHQQPQYQPNAQMYNNGYMNHPYNNGSFYPPQPLPQYHNGGNMYQQYTPYGPPPHIQSPQSIPHQHQAFVPAPISQHTYAIPQPSPTIQQQPYSMPQPSPSPAILQQSYSIPKSSPAIATPYQASAPPPPPTPPSPALPSVTPPPADSSHIPPTPQTSRSTTSEDAPQPPVVPFAYPLPWLSRTDLFWAPRRSRRNKQGRTPSIAAQSVDTFTASSATEMEEGTQSQPTPSVSTVSFETPNTLTGAGDGLVEKGEDAYSHNKEISSNSGLTSPPVTPAVTTTASSDPAAKDATPLAAKTTRTGAVVVPIKPALPKALPKDLKAVSENVPSDKKDTPPVTDILDEAADPELSSVVATEPAKTLPPPPKAWSTPKAWSGVFTPAPGSRPSNKNGITSHVPPGGKTTAESLADALKSFSVTSPDTKVVFLEPRGLVNTGNMCYMNSVLQVLMFCSPFYNFLEQYANRATHSFKSETPMIDAMIMFMREYPVIDSASSVKELRSRLKDGQLEQYGNAMDPAFVYDAIKSIDRFVNMQRGHQQDAEEFLGFLIDELHDECVRVMQTPATNGGTTLVTPANGTSSLGSDSGSAAGSFNGNGGWHEVGPKQKAAITRASGEITLPSPITKIFYGYQRSELRTPGAKDLIDGEPFKTFKLNIGADTVHNITDALIESSRSEKLQGNSPQGSKVTRVKQEFIETLPPVLILHLKRFQYDSTSGKTQKIWKNVGYPLELEIPKEVFPRQQRTTYTQTGFPKYRLIAVVYHHGQQASGGHYTVDVRRQDEREWIRLDDTVIRRIRREDVAESGNVDSPKNNSTEKSNSPTGNAFSTIEEGSDLLENDDGWKQASGAGKKWSSVANGATTPKNKGDKFAVNDKKVAYLLFYQKI